MADLDIIIKIEKLFAKAADAGCTPEERDAFQNKAMALLQEHRLTRADIGGHLAADDKLVQVKFGEMNGTYGRVRLALLAAVGRGFDVETFWLPRGNKRTVMLYGFKSDVEIVTDLANRLIADADMQAALVSVDSSWGSPQAAAARLISERRGFYLGYASAIGQRLRAAEKAGHAAAATAGVNVASAALVLVDRKKQVRQGLAKDVGKMRSSGTSMGGSSGHSRGHAAGSRADLSSRNGVGGGRKALAK